MNLAQRSVRTATLLPVAAYFCFVLVACDSFLGTNQAAFANEARVIVTGESAVSLLLLTTTNFTAQRDPQTGDLVPTVITADTLELPVLPQDELYNIRGADRFLVSLVSPDTAVTADIHLIVELDGREVFNQRATMRDASLTYFSFYSR